MTTTSLQRITNFIITELRQAPADIGAERLLARFIVIDKNDLPDVDTSPSGLRAGDMHSYVGDTPEQCRANANGLLALAEYLEANPPIDAEQVERIRDAVTRADRTTAAIYIRSDQIGKHVAEALYKEGVRVP